MKFRTTCAITLLFFVASSACASALPQRTDSWPLWENYKRWFVAHEGRVIDWHSNGCTTSEGQAYALFFALVANDPSTFKNILDWTQANLARGSLRGQLPAWRWEQDSGLGGGVTDLNSASDADLWIAYVLITAGRAWKVPEYTSLGRLLADRIAQEEVVILPSGGPMLLPGRTGFQVDSQTYVVNPSYLVPQLLRGLSAEMPQGPWGTIAGNLPAMLSKEVGNGFAMDWVSYQATTGYSPAVGTGSESGGSYDAIRVYLWAGMLDPQSLEYNDLLRSLSGMEQYMRNHPIPPERVAPNGRIISDQSPVGFSAAVTPFLLASGNTRGAAEQQARLKRELSAVTGLYGKEPRYYDQNLALFAEGWADGRFRFDSSGRLQLQWRK